ncbi:MAG: glycerate kinase [Candidatus Bathyarchaeota archaeon]|nr:glycerate kinase [Candidatus Bathyarchaeota archaeon]
MIKNSAQLVGNGLDDVSRRLRMDACSVLEAALTAVDPEQAIFNALKLENDVLNFEGGSVKLSDVNRVLVVGGGKAGGLMARAIEKLLGDRIDTGLVNVLEGTENAVNLKKIKLHGANHPVPSGSGVKGVKQMLELTEGLCEDDLVISLISGGGSALMPYPAEGIGLDDLQSITGSLLRAGATINELNAVRKHLSAFKGGQLARHCAPARVVSLILSDVIGDPLDIIASGPTAPDTSSFSDALAVLERYGLWDDAPKNIKTRIKGGIEGEIPDTPKEDDPLFKRVHNILTANNVIAASAAREKAAELGYNSMVLSTYIEGEARSVGMILTGISKEINKRDQPLKKPAALIIGGETTVTVKGEGVGGRNMEVALGASMKLGGFPCLVAALGTDGIDGPTESAGAFVDRYTLKRSNEKGLEPEQYLDENDSYHFFKELGDCIMTGPTGTNVNDLSLILIR